MVPEGNRDQWIEIRAWSKENSINPKEEEAAAGSGVSSSNPPGSSRALPEAGRHQRQNQAGIPKHAPAGISVLGPDNIPVDQFSWDHKGPVRQERQRGADGLLPIRLHQSNRSRTQIPFLCSEGRLTMPSNKGGWIVSKTALGSQSTKSKKKSTHTQPCLGEQLPLFFQELEQNDANGNLITICAVKVVFMTFLRVGSLTPMRWSEVDEERGVWVVPADRMKNGKEHLVPLTNPLKDVLSTLGRINGAEEFVFASPRSRGTGYLNPPRSTSTSSEWDTGTSDSTWFASDCSDCWTGCFGVLV